MEKENLQKSKDSVCNILIVAANICNKFSRPADSNGLIVVQLKGDLKYRFCIYFEPVRLNVIYQA